MVHYRTGFIYCAPVLSFAGILQTTPMQPFNNSNIGMGCDCVSISRVQTLLSDYPDRFRDLAFTSHEQQYCEKQPFPHQHYAARWTVKEAFIKAIDSSETSPDLGSIEIIHGPPPKLSLSGDGLDLLSQAASERDSSVNDTEITISLTHEKEADIALGFVIILF